MYTSEQGHQTWGGARVMVWVVSPHRVDRGGWSVEGRWIDGSKARGRRGFTGPAGRKWPARQGCMMDVTKQSIKSSAAPRL